MATTVDDFEDGDISEYVGDSNDSASVTTTNPQSGSQSVEFSGPSAITTKQLTIDIGETPFGCFVVPDLASSPLGSSTTTGLFYFGVTTTGDRGNIAGYQVRVEPESFKLVTVEDNDSTISKESLANKSVSLTTGDYHEVRVTTWDSNGNIEVELRDTSGTTVATLSVVDTTYSASGIGVGSIIQAGAPTGFADLITKTASTSGSPPSAPSGLTATLP